MTSNALNTLADELDLTLPMRKSNFYALMFKIFKMSVMREVSV